MTEGPARHSLAENQATFFLPRLATMHRKQRIDLALALLAASVVFNLIILVGGDTSPGWPLAAVILLATAGVSLLAERRER